MGEDSISCRTDTESNSQWSSAHRLALVQRSIGWAEGSLRWADSDRDRNLFESKRLQATREGAYTDRNQDTNTTQRMVYRLGWSRRCLAEKGVASHTFKEITSISMNHWFYCKKFNQQPMMSFAKALDLCGHRTERSKMIRCWSSITMTKNQLLDRCLLH